MTSLIRGAEVVMVASALDEAAEHNQRAKSCLPEHRRSFYEKKDRALLRALAAAPDQFFVDSISGPPPVAGISHLFSGRRFHVMLDRASSEMLRALAALPRRISEGSNSVLMAALAGEGAK